MQLAAGVRSPKRAAFPRVSCGRNVLSKAGCLPTRQLQPVPNFLPALASVLQPLVRAGFPAAFGPSEVSAEVSRAINQPAIRGHPWPPRRTRGRGTASTRFHMTKKGRYTHYDGLLLVLLLLVLALLLVELARVCQNHDDDDADDRQDDEGDEHLHLALLPPHLFSECLRARLEHARLTL